MPVLRSIRGGSRLVRAQRAALLFKPMARFMEVIDRFCRAEKSQVEGIECLRDPADPSLGTQLLATHEMSPTLSLRCAMGGSPKAADGATQQPLGAARHQTPPGSDFPMVITR